MRLYTKYYYHEGFYFSPEIPFVRLGKKVLVLADLVETSSKH